MGHRTLGDIKIPPKLRNPRLTDSILIETPEGNLSIGMRQVNGVYTQLLNKIHGQTGHLFQGSYKAILVRKDSHLLEVCAMWS